MKYIFLLPLLKSCSWGKPPRPHFSLLPTLRVRSRSWGRPPRPRCLTPYSLITIYSVPHEGEIRCNIRLVRDTEYLVSTFKLNQSVTAPYKKNVTLY
jgi:hypothetical protein